MKALGVSQVPEGTWHCEIKFDGYRAIAVLNPPALELWSRNHKPLAGFPEVNAALTRLRCRNAVLDGEIVALDEHGRSRFQLLQGLELGAQRPPVVYYVFDLLFLDGKSLLAEPLEHRRAALEALVGRDGAHLKLSPEFDVAPAALLSEAQRNGLEGIIAKTPGSRYHAGQRPGAWLKCKVFNEQEFVIGGFTPPKNSRAYFGSLVVGYYQGKELHYAGKVGTGFDRALLASLHARLQRLRVASSPFVDLPRSHRSRFGAGMTPAVMKTVTWVRPELVCQVRFAEWTSEGLLRQPVFIGLRTDKPATAVRREAPAPAPKRTTGRTARSGKRTARAA